VADDAKADEYLEQLREGFHSQILNAVRDLPAHQALQLADNLCTIQLNVLAGLRVTYRAAAKVDAGQVVEDWRRGLSLQEIMRKHGISRSAAYKHHPGRSSEPRRAG